MNLIQVLCSKSTVNYQLKTLEIVKFVTFLSQNANDCSYVLPQTPPPYHYSQGTSSSELCFICAKQWKCGRDPFNQNLDRSVWEKWSTSKGGPVFFETFPVWPNRSIEFWIEISGNFGWMDCALGWVPLGPDSTCNQPIAQRKILLDWYLRSTNL